MPKKFNLTSSAKEDLRIIWNYTIDIWDEAQADKYFAELYNRFQWLTENSKLGTDRDEVKEGYKSYFQGKHTIFYREVVAGIEIIGIPHQSEDIEQHFEIDHLKTQHKNLLADLDKEQQSAQEKTPEVTNDDLDL